MYNNLRGKHRRVRQFLQKTFSIVFLVLALLILTGSSFVHGGNAKYIILFIGDGWGAKHIEAVNKYTGTTPAFQSGPPWIKYMVSTFPEGGSYDTLRAWSDFNYVSTSPGTQDSACTASAIYSGSKTSPSRMSVSSDGSTRLFSIGERAKAVGKAVGSITTVPVSHATPGAWVAHNDYRVNTFAIADEGFFGDPNTTGTIATNTKYGGGHGPTLPPADIHIGAGGTNYISSHILNKLRTESGQAGKHVLVERQTGVDGGDALMSAANNTSTLKLAGLFDQVFHNANDSGYNFENPTLSESILAAVKVLDRNPNGFMLMVEGGAIDWASHANNMNQMIGEAKDFYNAIKTVTDWVDDPGNDATWNNTLVIVTADHETGYLTAGPGVFPDQPLGNVNAATLSKEKIVSNTGGRRASWEDTNTNNVIDAGETVYWYWNSGGHTNTLVALYARGTGAELSENYAIHSDSVRGLYLDNTDIFTVMNSAIANIGNTPPVANNDMAVTSRNIPVNINVITNDTDSDGTANPATVVIASNPANGVAVSNGDGTVTYTSGAGFVGTDSFTYTVQDNAGAVSNEATVAVLVVSGTHVFTAYNDLSWSTGQVNDRTTLYTTGQSGLLKDYLTGTNTQVTLTIAGGYVGSGTLTQGSNANSSDDAYTVFNGIVNSVGLISYSATNLTFTLTGLDPNLNYEFVLFGNRNKTSYTDRKTTTTISDIVSFTNASTPGATFSGTMDPTVTIVNGYNTTNGYVARFTNINPGSDGDMLITVSSPTGQYYANALKLRATQLLDTTPPEVNTTSPVNNETGVSVNNVVTATFNEAMDAGSITPIAFSVSDEFSNVVSGTVSYSGTTATFMPFSPLANSTTYTAMITTGVRDVAGNAMAANYTWSFTTAGEDMQVYYRFDEGSGTTAADSSGKGNTGTLINDPVWTTGRINNALSFDGVNDYVGTADSPFDFQRTDSFSVSAWIKLAPTTYENPLVSKEGTAPSFTGWAFYVEPGSLRVFLTNKWNAPSNGIVKNSDIQVDDNVWHHVAFTYNGTSLASGVNIYIDSSLSNGTVSRDNLSASILNDVPLNIGMLPGIAIAFNGLIDEVRIYNRALSAQEVLALFNE